MTVPEAEGCLKEVNGGGGARCADGEMMVLAASIWCCVAACGRCGRRQW